MDRRTALQGIIGILGTVVLPSEVSAKFRTCRPRSGYALIMDERTPADPSRLLNTTAPLFYQKDINSRSESFGKYRGPQNYGGKTIVLNLWSRDCRPCLKEFPDLELVYKSHDNVVILGLEADVLEGEKNEVEAALSSVTYPILGLEGKIPTPLRICQDVNTEYENYHDYSQGQKYRFAGALVSEFLYGFKAFPTSFIIDKKGLIRELQEGALNAAEWEEKLKSYKS